MGNFKVVAESLTAAAEQMSEPRYDGPDKQHPNEPYGLDVPDAALPETKEAINQLKNSTGILMTALKAGDAETKRLILSLKSAAAAYTEMDERSATALGTQGTDPSKAPPIEPVTPKPIDNIDVPKIEYGGYPSSPDDQWAKWTTAARAINEHGDPEAMQRVEAFQSSWGQYQTDLKNWVEANIPLEVGNWEGDAAVSCKNALLSLRSWWNDMANECKNLSIEAGKLLSAHKQLASVHPNMHDVETDGNGWMNPIDWSNFQYQSEYDRNNYENNINLTQIRPGGPPTISGLPVVKSKDVGAQPGTQTPGIPGTTPPGTSPDTGGPTSTAGIPEVPEMPSVSPASLDPSAGEQPSAASPSGGGSPSGGQGGGSPSGGGAPSGGMPSSGMPKGTEGMPTTPGLGEPSLKPASAGGGGGGMGGGGGGMPAGPLGPAVGADSVAASPSGARGAGVGPAGAPGGAGMGGMGGGMGGMGGGHGQGQGKEKRRNPNLAEDEDLYVEDRAYTEAVIGRRARKDAKDGK